MIIGFIVGFPTKGILERLLGVSGYRLVMDINTRELPFRKKKLLYIVLYSYILMDLILCVILPFRI